MKLICLEDLPDNFKVQLEDSFRKELFSEAVKSSGGFLKLAEKLNFDHSSLTKIRRGYRLRKNKKFPAFMRIPLLRKLIEITKIDIRKVEKNIEGLVTNKAVIKVNLPICVTEELASLIGHAFGDGHVSTQRFKYVNKRKELVDEVKNYTNLIFGHEGREFYIKNKECFGIEFPGVVGHLLHLVGAVHGRKTVKEMSVPNWIKKSSDEIKISFIRALFDDEGSVIMSKFQSFICISMYKDVKLIESHLKFLNEIRQILIELGIKPTKAMYKKDYKDTKEFGLRIYSFNSLLNFSKKIKFTHLLKNEKLMSILELKSYNQNFYQ